MQTEPDIDTRVQQLTHGSDLAWVANVLVAQRDSIIKGWLDAAVKQPFHESRPEGAVADHIPELFDALVAVLRRSAPRWIDISAPLSDERVLKAASDHARARFEQGLHPDDVVTEFRLLRQEIGRSLRLHLADSAPSSDVIGAELVVHDALDGAIVLALGALSTHITNLRDEFLATTAHDVQQPLTGIKASIQLARRALRQEPVRTDRIDQTLARSEAEVDRLAALVRTLADASRVSLGHLELETTHVNLGDVVQDVIERLDSEAASRICVSVRAESVDGYWDRLAVDRVLTNLVANALKYSPSHAPIRVTLDADAETVQASVRDEGIGLEADEIPELFERYSRSPTAREHHIHGVGLGLYLSRQLVVAMNGEIWAESAGRNRGAAFHIRLPRLRSGGGGSLFVGQRDR